MEVSRVVYCQCEDVVRSKEGGVTCGILPV